MFEQIGPEMDSKWPTVLNINFLYYFMRESLTEELFDDHESSMANHQNYPNTGRAQSRHLTALMEYLNVVLEYFIFLISICRVASTMSLHGLYLPRLWLYSYAIAGLLLRLTTYSLDLL